MSAAVVTVQPNTPANLIGLIGEQIPLDFTSSIRRVTVVGIIRGEVVSPAELPFVPSGTNMNLINNDYGLQGEVNLQTGGIMINSDYDTITGIQLGVSITNLNH